jgi:hypothetical protein
MCRPVAAGCGLLAGPASEVADQTTSFIEISIEAGILLWGNGEVAYHCVSLLQLCTGYG